MSFFLAPEEAQLGSPASNLRPYLATTTSPVAVRLASTIQ